MLFLNLIYERAKKRFFYIYHVLNLHNRSTSADAFWKDIRLELRVKLDIKQQRNKRIREALRHGL